MEPKHPNPFTPRTYGRLERVTERVYIWRNITNSSFVVGTDGVAVIDTQVNRPSAEEFLRALRTVTGKPIRYVVNTHYHWDHTNGNAIFRQVGAEIVSSALTKEFMVKRAPRQKEFLSGRGFELGDDPYLPDTTFKGELSLDLGDLPMRLFFAGCAETDDATAVHFPSENVLMSGDTVMTGSFPIFGQPVWDEGLQNEDWMQTIGRLMALKPAHLLPGHGPLAGEAEIALFLRIQRYFLEEVGTCVAKGMDIDAVLSDLEPKLPTWITAIPVVWGTPRYAILRVYRGLTKKSSDREEGWQSRKPSAIPRLTADDLPAKIRNIQGATDHLSAAHEAREGGDVKLQIAVLDRAVRAFPDDASLATAYAEALIEASRAEASVLEKGDYFSLARKLWDRVLRRDPDYLPAVLGKGRYLTMMAYRGGDDPTNGMRLLRQIIETRPGGRLQCEAEFYLGMGYRRLGDEARASEQFRRAAQMDPAFMPARLAANV